MRGQGVDQNIKEAVKHLEAAAGKGHQKAAGALGWLHLRDQNYIVAFTYLKMGAEQGDIYSTFIITDMLSRKNFGCSHWNTDHWFRIHHTYFHVIWFSLGGGIKLIILLSYLSEWMLLCQRYCENCLYYDQMNLCIQILLKQEKSWIF